MTDVQPLDVIFNGAFYYEVPHMILAAYLVAGFMVSSVYAVGWLKGRRDRYHQLGFAIPFTIAAIVMPFQMFVGDTAARAIAVDQPAKFAAMEYILETGPNQTEWIGGVLVGDEVKFGIPIPDLDSILVGFSADTVVTGLDQIPDDEEPPSPTLLHLAFDTMVGIASALLLLVAIYGWVWWRKRRLPESKWFWRAASVAGVATDHRARVRLDRDRSRAPALGRARAAQNRGRGDPAGGPLLSLTVVVLIYAALGAGTIWALRAMSRRWREEGEDETGLPYGPPAPAEETSK